MHHTAGTQASLGADWPVLKAWVTWVDAYQHSLPAVTLRLTAVLAISYSHTTCPSI
jgi:hypothetical protein